MQTGIIGLLAAIPATFWGVVVGSLFTIMGVVLSNWASDRRLRAQFANERELKTKDREMALRKEVLLSAAEAVDAGMGTISRLSNFDITNDEVSKAFTELPPKNSLPRVT